jgi:hypothetical protein
LDCGKTGMTKKERWMLSDEQVEIFAVRAAKGNNGGRWAEHYTDAQKEFWRRFIWDIESTMLAVQHGDITDDEILVGLSGDQPSSE